jgi:pimeloyl-ACP methyl ester carboxylesterase
MAAPVERYSESNGIRIHYLDWGGRGKQPLILLHGIARVAHNFDHLAPHFLGRHHVIAVDMRGHGDSGWHPEGAYMVEDYTSDIESLVEELNLRDIVLWGNSTGGRVAQMMAGLHPGLVAAAVVEDVGPERPESIAKGRAARMGEEDKGWASADDLLAMNKNKYSRTADAILSNFVEHGSRRRDDGRIVWKCDPAILKGFVPTELWTTVRKIKAPIIYILGGASSIVPPETQAELKKALPQAEIVTMPGLGHYPSDEKPEEFLAIVDGFLRRASPRHQ